MVIDRFLPKFSFRIKLLIAYYAAKMGKRMCAGTTTNRI